MKTERDKFLTEQMGEAWYESKDGLGWKVWNDDFSTWDAFGKLWEWSQKQPFWMKMISKFHTEGFYHFINPDRFANAVYDYLKKEG